MKKLMAMFSLSLLVAGTSFAQEGPKQERKSRTERSGKEGMKHQGSTPEQRAEKRTEMLVKKYNLSQAQQAKLKALHAKQENEMAALRSQRGTAGEKGNRDGMKAKYSQWESELKGILTKEQFAQYEADKKERMGAYKERESKKRQHHRTPGAEKKELKS